jgi:hypothetical protein
MPDLEAKRTLVKSPPELWEELSEVERLARHLGAFGEIKITRLEPEHTVAWAGEHASGTVSIESSGWGTRVTLVAALSDEPEPEPVTEPEPDPEPEPAPEPEPDQTPARKRGFWARLFSGWRVPQERIEEVPPPPEPVATALTEEVPDPPAVEEPARPTLDPSHAQTVLEDTLDALGSAHHRPFSRA